MGNFKRWPKLGKLAAIIVATSVSFSLALVSPGWASTASDELRARLANQGVAADKIEGLVTKYELGDTWDSMNSLATPVAQESARISGFEVTKRTFEDGSISILRTQVATNVLSRGSISNCTVRTGTGYAEYSGCLIQRDMVLFVMSFTADYGLYSGSNNDTIRNAYNPSYYACLGFCGAPSVAINRKTESGSLPAVAREQITYGSTPWFTSTYWLELRLLNQGVTIAEG